MEQIIFDRMPGREPERWVHMTCDEKIKPLYDISTYGRVRNHKGKIMKVDIDKDGYLKFTLQGISGKKVRRFSHRLCAMQFIPNPENKPEINHKNVITEHGKNICRNDDNYYKNLEWCTRQENVNHARENNLQEPQRQGEQAPTSKFEDTMVVYICSLMEAGYSNKRILRKLGFKNSKQDGYKEYAGLLHTLRTKSAWNMITSMFNY